MKEFITIRNFGPLKDIDNLELKPFTILIGESAIGKSTLMKLVSMMRYIYKMANIRSYLKLSKITSSPFRMRFESMIKQTGLNYMLTQNSEITYKVVYDNGHQYSISVANRKLSTLPQIAKDDLIFVKVSFISENRNVIPTWVEKATVNSGASLGFYFHETFDDFSRATAADQSIDLEYVNIKLHISHPKGKIAKYLLQDTSGKHADRFELREASSGIQTSAPLALIVKHLAYDFSFKDAFNRSVLNYLHDIDRLTRFSAVTEPTDLPKEVFIHVEEPELSLFPDAQCKLIDELFFAATHAKADRKLSLMFATHSPYILNYLNIVLHQNKLRRAHISSDNLAVYRLCDGIAINLVGKDQNGVNIVDTYDLTETMSKIYSEFSQLKA